MQLRIFSLCNDGAVTMKPRPGLNANARRLMLDTAGQQAATGTETAHGTDHHPATKAYRVQFNSRRGPVSFIRKSIKTGRPAAWSRTRLNHATNAPKPGVQKRLRMRAATAKTFPISKTPLVTSKKNSAHGPKSKKFRKGQKMANILR